MSHTIQTLKSPLLALEEITRIGKKCIVTVPNFGYWKIRTSLLFKGKIPPTTNLPENWYNSENIHLCTLKDFENLCRELKITIDEKFVINSRGQARKHLSLGFNLFSSSGVYKIFK